MNNLQKEMKKLVLAVTVILCACVGYDVEAVKPNEVGADESFTNRIFTISCNGDEFVDSKDVDKKCRKYASKFAFEKGYLYFSVIGQDGGSNTSVRSYTTTTPVTTYSNASIYGGGYSAYDSGTSTTYIPQTHNYTVTNSYKNYTFVLIGEKELKDWPNYYRVSDYYTPRVQQ